MTGLKPEFLIIISIRLMNKYFLFVAIGLFIVACSNTDSTNKTTTTASTEKPAIDGGKIYKQYCIACHGIAGDMGAAGAFNLTTSELSLEEKVAVITNGRNTMTPFKSILSEEKIEAVAKYTESLKK